MAKSFRAIDSLPRRFSISDSHQPSLGLQTPEVIHDVPDVRLGHLALVALHVELRAGAVADDQEDLAVGRSPIPLGIGQIGRVRAFGRHRAVALGVRVVTEAAVLLKERLARFDRFGRRRDRVLHRFAGGAAADGLRGDKRRGREYEYSNDARHITTHGSIDSSFDRWTPIFTHLSRPSQWRFSSRLSD